MSVTPYLMMDSLAEQRRRDVKASFGARRRVRRTKVDVCEATAVLPTGLLSRFRHAHAA